MSKYRKRPVVIDAQQFTKDTALAVTNWCRGNLVGDLIHIPTLEGTMTASLSDYIIRGIQGEFYPCKPDIFEATYEKIV